MSQPHVDLITNDWVARARTFKGRLSLDPQGCVQVSTHDHDIKKLFSGPYVATGGKVVSPEQGLTYLEAVAERLGDGTVLSSTKVHGIESCAYRHERP